MSLLFTVGVFRARGWEPHPTFPPAPPAGPTRDQLGTLEQFLVSHQTEMRRLLSGALGSLSQRLESVERKMEQLHAQSSAHGGSLAMLHSKVNSLRKNICSGCSNALPAQSMGSSYTYGNLFLFKKTWLNWLCYRRSITKLSGLVSNS